MKRLLGKTAVRLAVAMLALTPLNSQASWFSSDVSTEPLYRAHEAYLRKDLRTMASEIKELFKDPKSDETSLKNGLALLEKAYSTRSGNGIPVDWKLPSEITKMKVTLGYHRRANTDDYALNVSGTAQAIGTIKQLKVTRYPDQVVLDKQGNLGDWEDQIEPGDGPSFELDGPRTVRPAQEGLYLIHIELASGAVTEGWFILSNMVASDSPVVQTPGIGDTFTTRNPTLKWNDFKSPEYQSHEGRSLWMAVVKSDPPLYEWIPVWTMWEGSPNRTQVTVGTEPNADTGSVSQLADGGYNLYLSYKEERRFGDLRLGRKSITITPFQVRAN